MNKRIKILVAYDGSACAEAMLDDLQRAGLPDSTEAMAITVSAEWLPTPPRSSYEILETGLIEMSPSTAEEANAWSSREREEARRLSSIATERIRSSFPEWVVRTEVSSGSPATEILKKADEWGADLIVVGSHGRSALGRLLLGSISRKVVSEANCSVRVARGRVGEVDSPARLVVAVDGSLGSEAAVRAISGRAWPAGSEARVVTVVDARTAAATSATESANEGKDEWVKKVVDDSVRALSSIGLAASSVVRRGDPAGALTEEAEQWRADSIFVGATGLSRLRRFLLGSVSSAVATRAHCSVEVVRERRPSERQAR